MARVSNVEKSTRVPEWCQHLGGAPKESHILSENLTLHIMEGGVLKNKQGKNLPNNYTLLKDAVGEDIPEYVMRRIDHYLMQRHGDKRAERIKLAMEKAAAEEREAIRLEELQEARAAKKTHEEEVLAPEVEEEVDEDEEDFEDLEASLTGPSKRKTKKKK